MLDVGLLALRSAGFLLALTFGLQKIKTCVIATMREITTALIPVLKTRSTIRQIGQYNADHLRYGLRQTSVSHHT